MKKLYEPISVNKETIAFTLRVPNSHETHTNEREVEWHLKQKVRTHFFCEPSFPIYIKTNKKNPQEDSAVHPGSLLSFPKHVKAH